MRISVEWKNCEFSFGFLRTRAPGGGRHTPSRKCYVEVRVDAQRHKGLGVIAHDAIIKPGELMGSPLEYVRRRSVGCSQTRAAHPKERPRRP